MWAVMKEQNEFLEFAIVSKDIDLLETNAHNENLLHLAARRHKMKAARLVIDEIKARFRKGSEMWDINVQKDDWHLSPILRYAVDSNNRPFPRNTP